MQVLSPKVNRGKGQDQGQMRDIPLHIKDGMLRSPLILRISHKIMKYAAMIYLLD